MKTILILLTAVLTLPLFTFAEALQDPSSEIRLTHLDNGFRVVYAPSKYSKTVQIRLRVDAGRWSEEVSGVAHLLEHYMFKDAKMERNMTYLEVIKEHGGSGNAFVNDETTTYYATVSSGKEEWLLGVFGKMLVNKKFTEKGVEFAKGPVYLEIGRANPFHYLATVMGFLLPKNLHLFPGFWETEFGWESPERPPISDQITTAGLTASQLKRFYEKYYHAKNMTLFIAGHFNPITMEKRVREIFSSLPSGEAHGPQPSVHDPKIRPYMRSTSTSGTPTIEVGTKIHDLTLLQNLTLRIYLNHLSHRLMKEIRNIKGQTYTVRPDINIERKSGYAAVTMEAPREAYYQNLKLLRTYIDHEAREGAISSTLYKEAMELYKNKFELVDKDSSTMMDLAEDMDHQFREYEGNTQTPFELYQSLDLESYKKALKSVFLPEMQFERLSEPFLFFRYESALFLFLGIVCWSSLARKVFARKFDHARVRWVRKIKFPPAYSFQIMAVMAMFVFCSLGGAVLYHFWMIFPYVHRSFLISDYLFGQVSLAMMYFIAQVWFMILPRKLMVLEETLWIKSLGYASSTVPLKMVDSVATCSFFKALFDPRKLWKIKHRFYFMNIRLWEPGVLIELKNGKIYFVSLTEPSRAVKELHEMLKSSGPLQTRRDSAA